MSLKILVTSDFHAEEELKDAAIKEANSGNYDLFINLGDYMNQDFARDLFENIEIPAIGSTGNRDTHFDDEFLNGSTPVYNFLEAEIDDEYLVILIGGEFPDDIKEKVTDLIEEHGDNKKVIVGSHYPPEKLGDKIHSGRRIGFPQFRELIIKEKPAVWMSGHVHEDFGEYSLMGVPVLNTASEETGKAFSVVIGEDGGVDEIEEVELV